MTVHRVRRAYTDMFEALIHNFPRLNTSVLARCEGYLGLDRSSHLAATANSKRTHGAEQVETCESSQRRAESRGEARWRAQIAIGGKDGGRNRHAEDSAETLEGAVRPDALPISAGATALNTVIGVAASAM